MIGFLIRRLLFAAGTVVLTAWFAFGMIRVLRPERYPGQSLISGTWHDVDAALLHLQMGGPDLREMWLDGIWADVFLLAGGVVAAAILRLTLTLTIDAMGEEYVKTAEAKGLGRARVVRRHAAPISFVTVASLFGASAPIMVTNMVLVEWVFSIPGYFRQMRRALGQGIGGDQTIDIEMLQSLSLWAAMLIVAISLLGDLAIMRIDPRVRAGGRAVG